MKESNLIYFVNKQNMLSLGEKYGLLVYFIRGTMRYASSVFNLQLFAIKGEEIKNHLLSMLISDAVFSHPAFAIEVKEILCTCINGKQCITSDMNKHVHSKTHPMNLMDLVSLMFTDFSETIFNSLKNKDARFSAFVHLQSAENKVHILLHELGQLICLCSPRREEQRYIYISLAVTVTELSENQQRLPLINV